MDTPFHYEKLNLLNQVYQHTLVPYTGSIQGIEQIVTPLFPHQVTMVQRMHEYREQLQHGFMIQGQMVHGKIGIVGDEIGSGKTLSVLAYLASLPSFSSHSTPASSSPVSSPPVSSPVSSPPTSRMETPMISELSPFSARYFYSHQVSLPTTRMTNLIIVPHSLFHEWKQEIQTHTTLSYLAIETRRMLRGEHLPDEMVRSSFILTTNKCYKYVNDYAKQHGIEWNQIIVDEATAIYLNASDPPLHFQFLWLVTHQWIPLLFKSASFHREALYQIRHRIPLLHPELEEWLSESHATPYEGILVSSGFLKDYMAFHHPSRYFLVLRNSLQHICKNTSLPSIETSSIQCRANVSLSSLMTFYLTRHLEPTIHSHHIPHLFQSLNISFHPLTPYLLHHPPNKHPLIQRKVDDNECVICLERCEYPTIVSCCYHLYCGKCLLKSTLMSGKCPTCRDQIVHSRMNCFGTLLPSEHIQTKNKTEVCLDWIRTHPSGRFVIYSAFDNIFYQLFEEIDRMGRKAERLENHHFSMLKTIRNFKYGQTQILFVSNPDLLRGISLPFVTHLLFYHDQPSYEKKQLLVQSMNRWGRTQHLHVIHLQSEVQV